MSDKPYTPDDAAIMLQALEAMRSPAGADLRAALASLPDSAPPTVAWIAALRKRFPADLLHAGLTLSALQSKARHKFPDVPWIWATPEALEQASSSAVARHKAARFRATGASRILDLCCGIGGDAMQLADLAPVTAIDLSSIRTTCLRFNLEQSPPRNPVEIVTGDIETALPSLPVDAFFHIDPARRQAQSSGHARRSAQYADLIPGPALLDRLVHQFPGGVIKLSPAVDFDSLPPGHLELVSERGTVVQALLWVGRFTDWLPIQRRTATIVQDTPWSYAATPETPSLEAPPLQGFLHELDGSMTRAGLAAPYARDKGLIPLTSDGGYLLGASLVRDVPLGAFRILAALPFSESRVSRALAEMPADQNGPMEVKTRGRLPGVETDRLQKIWSKAAPRNLTVLIFRHADDVAAVIARRAAR
jgi:hypothetical protein